MKQDDAIDLWRSMKGIKVKKPERLCNYLIRCGGLKDQNGSISYLTGGPRGRPGLISRNGMLLDDATLKVWEQGFFDLAIDRPSISELLDLIDKDLRTDGVFRHSDLVVASELAHKDSIATELDRVGVAGAKSIAQLVKAIPADNPTEQDLRSEDPIPF